jgi:hypothetical protein
MLNAARGRREVCLQGLREFHGSWDHREEGKEVDTRTLQAKIARLGVRDATLDYTAPRAFE